MKKNRKCILYILIFLEAILFGLIANTFYEFIKPLVFKQKVLGILFLVVLAVIVVLCKDFFSKDNDNTDTSKGQNGMSNTERDMDPLKEAAVQNQIIALEMMRKEIEENTPKKAKTWSKFICYCEDIKTGKIEPFDGVEDEDRLNSNGEQNNG